MRLIFSILFCSFCVLALAQQDSKKAIKSSFQSLSTEEKAEVLSYAQSLVDMNKKMDKAIKKLSAKDQELVLRRIQEIESVEAEPVFLPYTEPETPTIPLTSIEFEELTHEFGEIIEGDEVTHIFKFKNTGNEPLVISNARGSCGCTVPEWPKDPIAPGKGGEMKVVFNSKNKSGKQVKTITVTANTAPDTTKITIRGNVTIKETDK